MTTTTPSPYNTARSLKSSPRAAVSNPSANASTPPTALKHIPSKSGGDISHVPPVSSSRTHPRPVSSGGASVSSSRSHTSNISNRLKVSPYAIPLSTRSTTEKPRTTPRPESTQSSRDIQRGDGSVTPRNPEARPHVALSPIHAPHEASIHESDHLHGRLSAPSIDILLIREGLDPTTVLKSELGQPDKEQSAEIPGIPDGSTFIEDIPDNVQVHQNEPIERTIAPEPTPTPIEDPSPVDPGDDTKLNVELGQSLNKALEGAPNYANHSQDSLSPSPIPLMNNLNLSQYSCAFADNLKGYCSDINSDISHHDDRSPGGNVPQSMEDELDARYSVDVQVTSRLYDTGIVNIDADGIEPPRVRGTWFVKILCCGCMQGK